MQKKHLYNSKLGKVRWFIKRFGATEIFLKPLRVAFAPVILPSLPRKTFQFHGQSLEYFYHAYNMTWASERCVEVPIARYFAAQASSEHVLEVGNVLSHYSNVDHTILDKFEKGDQVINEDILTFRPEKKFDRIISVSTFEHIGFDDEAEGSSADKIRAAVAATKHLLSSAGRLIVTAPIGYNPELDDLLLSGRLGTIQETYLRRYARLEWRESPKEEALKSRYKSPFPYANAIVVAVFTN